MPARTAGAGTRKRTGLSRRITSPPWKKSRFRTPATILKVSVRPAPTRPKTPVICPAKTESELFLTIGAILRFCTVSTRSPARRTVEFRCVVGDNLFAVAQHGNAVGEHQRLFERMRDEDYRHAALLEIADEAEE